jgi:polyisoprenoid-binding protein YceI
MKPIPLLLLFSACWAAPALANPTSTDPTRVPAGAYVLDPRHASLIVKVPHMGGFSRFTMRFDKLQGSLTYDPAAWQSTNATIEIETASIDTGDHGFDKTVAGFLDADKFPEITFVSQSIQQGDGASGKLTGNLTFHGVTRPVIMDVTFNGVGPGLLGAGTRLGLSGVGRIKRSDFGVTAVRSYAGDDVDLLFEVEFTKK